MNKRKGVIICLAMVFFFQAGLLCGLPQFRPDKSDNVEKIRGEIRLLNLVNGLELTQDQMDMILKSAEESERLRQGFKALLLSQQGEKVAVLEEIRGCLRESRDVPLEIAQQYHRLEKELKRKRLTTQERIRDLAKAVEEGLEPHQLYGLQQFVPCIIPPKGETRIGQDSNHKGFVRNLERLRQIPDSLYQRRKDEIAERTLEKMKLLASRGVEIKNGKMKRYIRDIYDEIRNLDEAEFKIQKERLAEKLVSPFKPSGPPNNLTRKIEAFLLSSEIMPILEERIKRGK